MFETKWARPGRSACTAIAISGNLLWDEHGPVFVDLDDCLAGPAIQDLWMLLSGPAAEQQRQWRELTEGYEQFGMLDFGELRLIEPLRALRMLHHAAWLATCWSDPAFPRHSPWFGGVRYWEEHVNDLAGPGGRRGRPAPPERMPGMRRRTC